MKREIKEIGREAGWGLETRRKKGKKKDRKKIETFQTPFNAVERLIYSKWSYSSLLVTPS